VTELGKLPQMVAMSETDIDDRPHLNAGNEWSEMDLFDIANSVRLKRPVEAIGDVPAPVRRAVRGNRRGRAVRRTRPTHRRNGRQRSVSLPTSGIRKPAH
jgi:hypothetical protein